MPYVSLWLWNGSDPEREVPEKQLLRETWFNEVQDAMGDVRSCLEIGVRSALQTTQGLR